MDQASLLVRLQEIDTDMRRAQKQLDEMPEKRAIIQTRRKIAEVEQLKAKAERLVHRLQQDRGRFDDESSQVREKLDSEQKRMMSGEITNAKEIQHITRELDALKRRLDKLDIDTLNLMEKIETAEGQVARVETALQQFRAQEEARVEEFTAKGGSLQTNIDELGKERQSVAASLDPELLERYEALRDSKAGIGAGTLVGTACTACRMELPAEKVAQLQAGDDIATCPQCRRLLVVRHTESDQ